MPPIVNTISRFQFEQIVNCPLFPSKRAKKRDKAGSSELPASLAEFDYCWTATGATLPVEWISTISFRGHLVTQMPQEVHLL